MATLEQLQKQLDDRTLVPSELTKKQRDNNNPYHRNNNIYLMIEYFESGHYAITQGCYDEECHLHAKKNNIISLPLVYGSFINNEH